MHKLAVELVRGDTFVMAGVHLKIIDVVETDDEDMIKIKCVNLGNPNGRRCYLTLPKALFMHIN